MDAHPLSLVQFTFVPGLPRRLLATADTVGWSAGHIPPNQ